MTNSKKQWDYEFLSDMSILRSRSALDLYEFFTGVYGRRKWGGWDFQTE
jgi:hypothetical protein